MGAETTFMIVTIAVFASGIMVIIFRLASGKELNFYSVERVAFPVALSGIILSPFIDITPVAGVICAIAIVAAVPFVVAHFKSIIILGSKNLTSPFHLCAYLTMTAVGGLALGKTIQVISLIGQFDLTMVAVVGSLVFAFLCVLSTAIGPYDPGRLSVAFFDGKSEENEATGIDALREKAFKSIADDYGLSKREGEIVSFIAKGRSTPYISSELHISESTVKSHAYRIYQKLEINSRQALIDLAESYLNKEK